MINLDMCGMGSNILLTYDKIDQTSFDIECMENIINDSNALVLKQLPFGDYNCFVNNRIPSIFIINSFEIEKIIMLSFPTIILINSSFSSNNCKEFL